MVRNVAATVLDSMELGGISSLMKAHADKSDNSPLISVTTDPV